MQMRNIINTNKAPAAIGTYSQAVESNGILFTSGQVGIDPETSEMVEGGIEDQAIRVLKNIYAILSESGLDNKPNLAFSRALSSSILLIVDF